VATTTTNDRPQAQGLLTHFGKISNGYNSATRQPIPFMFDSRVGFRGQRIKRRISGWLKSKMAAGGYFEKSNSHSSKTHSPILYA